ncbi:MAG: hhoB [Schlesneria sp.]|nr:hhoB [Schlesneria sp.]
MLDPKNLVPSSIDFCGRKLVDWIAIALVSVTWCSITLGQQADKISFGESPVDGVAAKIGIELKSTKPTDATAPDAAAASKLEKPLTSADTTKKEAKPGKPGKAVTSQKVKTLEANALKCQTAEEALILYKFFMAAPDTTTEEKEQAQTRYEYWDQAAIDQLVRVGPKWMAKEDADALQKEADDLVREAMELLNVDNFTAANAKLEKARKVYPEHLESVFLLAVNAFLKRDFKIAETKFNQCLSRAPNNIALLNNVAICEIQMKRYAQAVKHWDRAATLDLDNSNVAQNIGQFVSDVSLKRFVNVEKNALADATEIYQRMITKDPGNRANSTRGYVVMRMLRSNAATETPDEESRVIGNGTGFVIAEGYVLTNRHVVDDADSLVIQDPTKGDGLLFHAKVVAISKELDIALLECRQLKAPAVPVNTTPVGRGTEVMAFGFPMATVVGKGLKATRGIITGLPSDATEKMLVLDVHVNPGNSGGPLCDRSGRVVGVVAAKTINTTLVQSYGLAIPINDALPFIKQHIRDYASPKVETKTAEWTDVDAVISPSTVMILIQKKQ